MFTENFNKLQNVMQLKISHQICNHKGNFSDDMVKAKTCGHHLKCNKHRKNVFSKY